MQIRDKSSNSRVEISDVILDDEKQGQNQLDGHK